MSSRARLTALFLAVLLPPAVTLIWLGVRLLQQDQTLQAQRELESREAAAEIVTRSLSQSLLELEHRPMGSTLPDDGLEIVVSSVGVQGQPAGRLLWTPSKTELPEAATQPFADAEKVEFRDAEDSALTVYRGLAAATDPQVRAGALLRLARVERNQHRIDKALDAYRSLAAIQGIAFDGTPSDFLARRSMCDLLETLDRSEELRREAKLLETDFVAGQWTLDRPTWELAAGQLERWTGHPANVGDRKALSAAADWLWEMSRKGTLAPSGRESVFMEGKPITISWRSEPSPDKTPRLTTVVIGPTILRDWIQKASSSGVSDRVGSVSLMTVSGELFAGDKPDSTTRIVKRNASDTGLPWTLVLSGRDASREASAFAGRRRLLATGLAAIVLLLAGGSYFLWRVIERELAVARLQTDFVAAVSHEFRTPLTSLKHVTELLEEDDGLPPGPEQERRKTFYSALSRNTERLHRLVESLLDFSRMETGRKPWNFELMDAGTMVSGVAAEFQKEVASSGVEVDVAIEQAGAYSLKADAAALGHALWNLLDNAVKYSPQSRSVHVVVGRHPRGVAISVRDEGLGIPVQERREIFRKFVRGRKATELGIKGTGLGLALVAHIVSAHGGAIEVESEEGKGSTFRLVLPAQA